MTVSEDEGDESEGLSGTSEVMWTASPGVNCDYVTVVSGGPFLALPCGISYDLVGTQQSPADPLPDGGGV